MSTDSNRQTSKTSTPTPSAPLQASDFFPPGAGWNTAVPPEHIVDRGPKPDQVIKQDKPLDRNKH